MIDQFFAEYWIFVEALVQHASGLLGVDWLNAFAAAQGYPLGGALALSAAGFACAFTFLSLGRPGWGLAGLALAEELSALALASAVFAHGASLPGGIALLRVAAVLIAVLMITALLRKTLRLSRETAAVAR